MAAMAVGPHRASAATGTMTLTLPADTLTGMIGAVINVGGDSSTPAPAWRLTAQLGHLGDYPVKQTIKSVNQGSYGSSTIHFDTAAFKDGVWTLSVEHTTGNNVWVTDDYKTVVFDNRPDVPLTEPGTATGTLKVVPNATGTVGVQISVDANAVEWTLKKRSATDTNTKTWSALYNSGLRNYTYHWYTRNESPGQYTLRLEVFDTNKHSRYTDFDVTVDNRFLLPQTEPGTATAAWSVPKIVTGAQPLNIKFDGTVRSWRLQSVAIGSADGRGNAIASGQLGAEQNVIWDTTKSTDGTYLIVMEVEDENRHISQSTATTTVANKVTTTLQQPMGDGEEHKYNLSVAGGLTSFRLDSTPLGYYQVTVSDLDGKVLASQRMQPLSLPLQLDMPAGKYQLAIRSLFVLPGSKYTIQMQGAIAYTIPLTRLTTSLPLTLRQTASVPLILPTGLTRPATADWSVDDGAPTTVANPDGSMDIGTASLAEGRHVLAFRAVNAVGFTTVSRYPFVVDNQPTFADVPDTHPARWAVELLKDAGITNGYSDGTFKPTATVTRAEFAKMLSLAAGLDVSKPYSGAFGDVQAVDWFAPYVEAVYSAGMVKGYATDSGMIFKPSAPVSRAELMVMLLRAADVPEVLNASKSGTLTLVDWGTTPDWAKPSLYVGMKLNLLSERYGRKLEPNSPAERGEVALAVARLLLNQQLMKAQ
jgi:hypothetical protein